MFCSYMLKHEFVPLLQFSYWRHHALCLLCLKSTSQILFSAYSFQYCSPCPPMFLAVIFLYCTSNFHFILIIHCFAFFFPKELCILSSVVLPCLPCTLVSSLYSYSILIILSKLFFKIHHNMFTHN